MNIEKSAQELMKRYLKAVSKYLPLKKRDDIAREVESMILDICEERYSEIGVDEKRMESVLVELGKPSRLAAKYREEKPLIGPELIPIFKLVLLIICLITTTISLIDFSVNTSNMTISSVWLYFIELFSSLTGIVGTVFIIFVILERVIKNKSEIDFNEDNWKVKDLPQTEEKLPGRGEIIAGLIFSVILIVALNLFVDKIGIYNNTNGVWNFTPILTENFINLLPLFSVRIAVGALVILPLIVGPETILGEKRNYYYQIAQMGLTVFDIGIIILFISKGMEYFFIKNAFKIAGIEELSSMAGVAYTAVLLLLLGLSIWSLFKRTLVILPKGRVL